MLSTLFGKRIWDRRRSIVWWLLGIASVVLLTVAFYPTIRDQQEEYERIFEGLEDLAAMFGVNDIAELTQPAGYVTSQIYANVFPIVLLVFGIGFGAAAVAGEEERRTMDLLLSQPISRRNVVLQSFASMAALIGVLCAATFALLLASNGPVGLDLSVYGLLAATVGSWLLGIAYATLALAAGAATGRRGQAIGIAAGAGVAGYVLFGLAPLSSATERLQVLSPFYWFLGGEPVANGLDPMFIGLVIATVGLLGIAVWAFERRDVLG